MVTAYNWRQDLKMAIRIVFPNAVPAPTLPGVELPEAAVQVFEGSDEEPPAVDAHTGPVVEVWVQHEDRVELLTVPESSHQRWVVMQPESLAEPVDTCVSHAGEIWEHITDISSNLQTICTSFSLLLHYLCRVTLAVYADCDLDWEESIKPDTECSLHVQTVAEVTRWAFILSLNCLKQLHLEVLFSLE